MVQGGGGRGGALRGVTWNLGPAGNLPSTCLVLNPLHSMVSTYCMTLLERALLQCHLQQVWAWL